MHRQYPLFSISWLSKPCLTADFNLNLHTQYTPNPGNVCVYTHERECMHRDRHSVRQIQGYQTMEFIHSPRKMYIRTYYIVHIARQTKCRKSLARLKEDRGTTARRTARRPRKQPRGLAHSWPLLARFNPEADLIGTQPTKSKSNERKACFLDVRG